MSDNKRPEPPPCCYNPDYEPDGEPVAHGELVFQDVTCATCGYEVTQIVPKYEYPHGDGLRLIH